MKKDDSQTFVFTLKNPHGVEPTRFLKKKNGSSVLFCNSKLGPCFAHDISICDRCNIEKSYTLCNDGFPDGCYCHPSLKASLFVDSDEPTIQNNFKVLDYEVFGIENYNDYVYHACKYPDIIWSYLKTNDISEESLRLVGNEDELRNDLNVIHCKDTSIQLKISRYFFKNPSELLPNTQLVDMKYDKCLKEWLGSENNWKLIYRASEHDYTARSFHEYCDDKGPTLIVIKSSEGWIFGGYTTQSWSGYGIYNDMIFYIIGNKDDDKAFIFTLKNSHGVEPTQFMKKEEKKQAICCYPDYGPLFGSAFTSLIDIYINDKHNEKSWCFTNNNGNNSFECHTAYKASLFVNTAGPNERNYFTLLDYEVFTH